MDWKSYIEFGDKNPYAVFRQHEYSHIPCIGKYRTSLTKPNAEIVDGDTPTPSKHIPTWPELKQFLEKEVTIRVHAEKRNANRPNAGQR